MYQKSNKTRPFQEFIVKNYTLEEINQKYEVDLTDLTEILKPPITCLLPETKFYIQITDTKYKKLQDAPSNNGFYTILLHPEAIMIKSHEPIFLSIKIDFQDWCKPGKTYRFPLMESNNAYVLDPFKTKPRLERRGLPPYLTQKEKNKQKSKLTQTLNILKKLGLEKTQPAQEIKEILKFKS